MLITIKEFRHRVASDSAALISRLQQETGRYGSDEAQAWESSLTKLSRAFEAPSFQRLHLFFGSRGNLALEYQLPAASSWADVVLLGRYESAPAAVILELKDWATAADKPGKAEGLIERAGRQELHPSDQVRGYTEYCRRFHSAIEGKAKVHGCVLFTHEVYTNAYTMAPNERLARNYPMLAQRVSVVDFDIPFWSVLKIMFKWMAAAFVVFCCFLPVIIVIWLILMAVFAGLINGAMSNLQH